MKRTTPLSLYSRLEKSNCGECGKPTCMAFAVSVVGGELSVTDCPRLEPAVAGELSRTVSVRDPEDTVRAALSRLREEALTQDFAEVAPLIGAHYIEGRLHIRCLIKDFVINPDGVLESPCHVNPWVEGPLLNYLKTRRRSPLANHWVSFAELAGGSSRARYFIHRCEEPFRSMADSHREIFFDLLGVFGGSRVTGFPAHEAWVIHPLPRVPMLVLYTAPEEGAGSTLRLLLDRSADTYLDAEFIIFLGRGLVEMFKKIIANHEYYSSRLMSL